MSHETTVFGLKMMLKSGLEKLNWDSQQGRDLATSGRNKKNFIWADLIFILWGKSGIIKFEFKPA
jgi:hypothetical protein